MPKEQIFFHKGLAYDARRNLQQEGYLKQAVNITYGVDGEQTIRPKFTAVNTTPVGAIHSIRRFRNIIVIGDGTHLRFRSALSTGDFTDIGSGFANAIWTFREYKQFLHGVNGTDEVLIDENGNCFPATIEAPVTAPTLADSSSAGNPSGTYAGYASYEITFPNGMKYETGLSAGSSDVTVSSEKINWSAIPTSSYAAYYAAAGAAFNIVKLLLHCEGLDGATTVTDSSGQHTVTLSGAVIDTAQAKFGTGSILFDGTGDYVWTADHADFNYGTGTLTIDGWVRFSSLTGQHCLYSQASTTTYVTLYYDNTAHKIVFSVMSAGTRVIHESGSWTPSAATWYHVAVVRGWGGDADDWAITVDGTAVATFTNAGTLPDSGAALWIGLHPTTVLIDDGATGHGATVVNHAAISAAQYKFANGSLLLDGTDDSIAIADHANWTLGAADFTIECFIRLTALPGAGVAMPILSHWSGAADQGWAMYVGNAAGTYVFTFAYTTDGTAGTDVYKAETVTPVVDTWYHVAAKRSGTELTIWWDGVQLGAAADVTGVTIFNSTDSLRIGVFGGGAEYFNGYIDELRISNVARSISVPSAPYTSDANTVLLLHCDYIALNGWIDEYRISKGAALWTAAFTAPTKPHVAAAIKRKLYRGPGTTGTLGDIYYLDTVDDNTTTTYTDNSSDATIGANDASMVDDYCPAPDSRYVDYLYGRCFWLDDDHPWRLYYSEAAGGSTAEENEAILPIATEDENWDDLRVAGFEDCEPQGLVSWGMNLYIPLRHTWSKKQGNDPDTWSYKKTWCRYGVGAPYATAISMSPAGVIFVTTPDSGECGLALFNGQTAEMFTSPKLDYIFNTDLNKTYIHMCRGCVSGHYYHLLYPSGSNTDVNKWLAIDLRRFPDIRVAYWEGLSARCFYSYTQGTGFYVGTSDGYVKYLDSASTETMGCYIETHELIGGSPALANEEKVLRALHYNINTNSANVNLAIYIDGTQATWPDGTTTKTITGSGDAVQVMRDFPPNFRGYNFRIYVYATSGLGTFTVYSPWSLSFEAKEG